VLLGAVGALYAAAALSDFQVLLAASLRVVLFAKAIVAMHY
jgi:hypothetical protein